MCGLLPSGPLGLSRLLPLFFWFGLVFVSPPPSCKLRAQPRAALLGKQHGGGRSVRQGRHGAVCAHGVWLGGQNIA